MKKICSLVVILSIILGLLCGCDPYSMHNRYPRDRSDKWYCQELDFTLDLNQDTSKLQWNDQDYSVVFATQASYFVVFLETENGAGEDDILFDGSWSYRGKNLVLKIDTDKLFGGAYKTLIFEPME